MNVLFIGDIVGPEATAWVAGRLPALRRDLTLDLVVANGENCAISAPTPWAGFGMTLALVEQLLSAGVDVVTSGNHGWDGPEADAVHRHPRVLRPLNVAEGALGTGVATVQAAGEPLTVVNLADAVAVEDALPAYPAWRRVRDATGGTVVVGVDYAEFAEDGRLRVVAGFFGPVPEEAA